MTARIKCSVDGCGDISLSLGFCRKHYARYRRHGDPLAGRTYRGEARKWVEDHKDYVGDDCLIYPYNRTRDGYAVWKEGYRTKTIYIHNLYCEHKHGPCPPDKQEAGHTCGNGHLGCVNPNHVRWVTRKENEADKKLHGTYQTGEKNPSVKIDEGRAKLILALKGKFSQIEIARIVGTSRRNVSNVQTGATWGWLNYSPPPKRRFLTNTRFGGFFVG